MDEDSWWPWRLHVRRKSRKDIYVDSPPSPTKPGRRITRAVTQIDVSPGSTTSVVQLLSLYGIFLLPSLLSLDRPHHEVNPEEYIVSFRSAT
ncbi:hypothetical protein NQZ68_028163, partial [Dissostichus eleginoides]